MPSIAKIPWIMTLQLAPPLHLSGLAIAMGPQDGRRLAIERSVRLGRGRYT